MISKEKLKDHQDALDIGWKAVEILFQMAEEKEDEEEVPVEEPKNPSEN